MRVAWLTLTNFRSYPSLEWEPDPAVNVLIGENGAGKTNVLESIDYLATLRSFRLTGDRDLIADNKDVAVIRAGMSNRERDRLVEIQINRLGPRQTQVDKSRLRRTTDLLGVVRVIAFLPGDLDLVKRGPAGRRDLLDSVAVQLWPAAHLEQAEFDRSLRQRNAFLRRGVHEEATLAVWDSRLSESGGRLLARRARVLEALGPVLDKAYGEVSQDQQKATIGYTSSWSDDTLGSRTASDYAGALLVAFQDARKVDYDRRLTSVGPHRDEPLFRLDSVEPRTHGSQGEQRTMAIAVKLAAHRAVADRIGEAPILLLDDVFSELDPERSLALAKSLPSDTQIIITSARPADVPTDGAMWTVNGGVRR